MSRTAYSWTPIFLAWVELFEEGGGYLLHYPYLLSGQVLPPAPGGGLAVGLALPLLLLGYVLPGVLLHRPLELLFVDLYIKLGVDPLHGGQGVGPQLLVAHQHLRSLVRLVGLL